LLRRPVLAAPRSAPLLLAGPDVTLLLADGGGFSSTADELAGSLFGASLFPWLAMLYWLKHPCVAAPSGVSFGLTFLLAFVFGSIPAAIGAGALYGVSLADADWLHGAAESLLAITNCVVVLGFRASLTSSSEEAAATTDRLRIAATTFGALAAFSAVSLFAAGGATVHTPWLGGIGNLPAGMYSGEPPNALSVPTWTIHTSSLVEWLVAMGLAWRYAKFSGQPQWRGVTWGMLPLHTSGIVACTYHLFYNASTVTWCVTLQAAMTCLGNTTLALACLRLALACGWTWQIGKDDATAAFLALLRQMSLHGDDTTPVDASGQLAPPLPTATDAPTAAAASATPAAESAAASTALIGWEDLGEAWAKDSDLFFLVKLAALSGGLAYLVKYAPALAPPAVTSAWASFPDEGVSALAVAVIVLPTILNCFKWLERSKVDADFVGDI